MDELTAALSEDEARRLFGLIRELKSDGTTIMGISHKLSEVFDIGDAVTVLCGWKAASPEGSSAGPGRKSWPTSTSRECPSWGRDRDQKVAYFSGGKGVMRCSPHDARGQR